MHSLPICTGASCGPALERDFRPPLSGTLRPHPSWAAPHPIFQAHSPLVPCEPQKPSAHHSWEPYPCPLELSGKWLFPRLIRLLLLLELTLLGSCPAQAATHVFTCSTPTHQHGSWLGHKVEDWDKRQGLWAALTQEARS